jgi:DNA-binding transcriptional MerR regulator
MSVGRDHLSIGEVLAELRKEFPDVTVSKIRFLESEGLIAPERTPSGYRKFIERDVERLRFILMLQRDSYLPLKVIRERLAAWDGTAPAAPEVVENGAGPAPDMAAPLAPAAAGDEAGLEDELADPPTALHLSESDLAGAAGLDLGQVRALREFGVICEHTMNGVGSFYDHDDLVVGRIARDFFKYGIEPRHLKMFRHFAEREAALFEQVVLPSMRHRNQEARRQAQGSLSDLARLARKLRQAFLRQTLRETLARRT